MKVEANIKNEHIYILAAILVVLSGLFFAYAYGGSNPAIVGHSAGELVVTGESIVNESITGADIANNSIQGTQIEESTLGTVPSASSASSASICSKVGSSGCGGLNYFEDDEGSCVPRINSKGNALRYMTGSSNGPPTLTSSYSGLCIGTHGGRNYSVGLCPSLREFKENITTLSEALPLLSQMRPVSFVWKETGEPSIGFIAEEVAKVEPKLAMFADGELAGVQYEKFAAVLTKAIMEQQHQIDQLTSIVCQDHPTMDLCQE
ncbi:hypothetical protein GF342_01250 [Candidatus Woesearchaeota archaeon]|nr:hypothetical protein [Candidatus Woesearchaeota archaeon]